MYARILMDLSISRPVNIHRLTVDVDSETYRAVSRLQQKYKVPKTRVVRELLKLVPDKKDGVSREEAPP